MKKSTYRIFVLFMTMIDMVCCCVSIPFEIVDELFPFSYMELISCKIFRFVSTCVAVASVFMLVVTSLERYGKVCKPDGYVMSETAALFFSVIVLFAAVVFTFPAIYVYGRKAVTNITERGYYGNNSTNVNVTGYECSWGENIEKTLYFRFYHTWILLTLIGSMVILIVVYCLIWSTLRNNGNLTRRFSECHNRSTSLIPSENNYKDGQRSGQSRQTVGSTTHVFNNGVTEVRQNDNGEVLPNGDQKNGTREPPKDTTDKSARDDKSVPDIGGNHVKETWSDRKISFDVDYSPKAQLLRDKLRYAMMVNGTEIPVTKVALALTLLFIGCCLPYVVCLIVYISNVDYVITMSTTALVLFLIGFRLYLVNSVVKGFVYALLDRQFRGHLADVYRSVFNGCKTLVSRHPK